MNILCLNTAFPIAFISLKTERGIFYREVDAEAKSSEKVLPEIESILMEAKIEPKDLDICSVVIGPGSFTGIRIGVSIVKGFSVCFENLKFVAIDSLDLMAYSFFCKNKNFSKDFLVVQNALSNRFFVSKYLGGEKIMNSQMVGELPKNDFCVGLSFENLDGMNEIVNPNSEDLLNYSLLKIKNKNFVFADELEPLYIRLAQAEENLKR